MAALNVEFFQGISWCKCHLDNIFETQVQEEFDGNHLKAVALQ